MVVQKQKTGCRACFTLRRAAEEPGAHEHVLGVAAVVGHDRERREQDAVEPDLGDLVVTGRLTGQSGHHAVRERELHLHALRIDPGREHDAIERLGVRERQAADSRTGHRKGQPGGLRDAGDVLVTGITGGKSGAVVARVDRDAVDAGLDLDSDAGRGERLHARRGGRWKGGFGSATRHDGGTEQERGNKSSHTVSPG